MNIRSPLLASCIGLLFSAGAHASALAQRDTFLLEFVQDMAWLEETDASASTGPEGQARLESMNSFFDAALDRLGALSPQQFTSLEEVSTAFAVQQRLLNQLVDTGQSRSDAPSTGVDLASFDASAPKVRVRLENLNLNYLHIAQMVLFDELAAPQRRLAISADTKQRVLAFIANYPVDKENADGYLSAMWFIREGLKKWKCADEI